MTLLISSEKRTRSKLGGWPPWPFDLELSSASLYFEYRRELSSTTHAMGVKVLSNTRHSHSRRKPSMHPRWRRGGGGLRKRPSARAAHRSAVRWHCAAQQAIPQYSQFIRQYACEFIRRYVLARYRRIQPIRCGLIADYPCLLMAAHVLMKRLAHQSAGG